MWDSWPWKHLFKPETGRRCFGWRIIHVNGSHKLVTCDLQPTTQARLLKSSLNESWLDGNVWKHHLNNRGHFSKSKITLLLTLVVAVMIWPINISDTSYSISTQGKEGVVKMIFDNGVTARTVQLEKNLAWY